MAYSEDIHIEAGISVLRVVEDRAEAVAERAKTVEIPEDQPGICAEGGELVVEGIQIPAVPLGKFQGPGQGIMELPGICDGGAFDGDFSHQGSPYRSWKLS